MSGTICSHIHCKKYRPTQVHANDRNNPASMLGVLSTGRFMKELNDQEKLKTRIDNLKPNALDHTGVDFSAL